MSSVLVYEDPSLDRLNSELTAAGEPFADAIRDNTTKVMGAFLAAHGDMFRSKRVAVISIPRGGIPTAAAAFEALEQSGEAAEVLLCESQIKDVDDDARILGESFYAFSPEVVLIADGIVASGTSIERHFPCISQVKPEMVLVLANATTDVAVERLFSQAGRSLEGFQQVAGRVFKDAECQYVMFGEKRVLFVGYNEANGVNYNLPDFGDYLQTPSVG